MDDIQKNFNTTAVGKIAALSYPRILCQKFLNGKVKEKLGGL